MSTAYLHTFHENQIQTKLKAIWPKRTDNLYQLQNTITALLFVSFILDGFFCTDFVVFYSIVCKLWCLDSDGKIGNVPVDQNSEAVSVTSVNLSVDTCKLEATSNNCNADRQNIEQSNVADRQTENTDESGSSQCRSNETTAAAAFYCRSGTDCYESFGDVVHNANKTSKLLWIISHVVY